MIDVMIDLAGMIKQLLYGFSRNSIFIVPLDTNYFPRLRLGKQLVPRGTIKMLFLSNPYNNCFIIPARSIITSQVLGFGTIPPLLFFSSNTLHILNYTFSGQKYLYSIPVMLNIPQKSKITQNKLYIKIALLGIKTDPNPSTCVRNERLLEINFYSLTSHTRKSIYFK